MAPGSPPIVVGFPPSRSVTRMPSVPAPPLMSRCPWGASTTMCAKCAIGSGMSDAACAPAAPGPMTVVIPRSSATAVGVEKRAVFMKVPHITFTIRGRNLARGDRARHAAPTVGVRGAVGAGQGLRRRDRAGSVRATRRRTAEHTTPTNARESTQECHTGPTESYESPVSVTSRWNPCANAARPRPRLQAQSTQEDRKWTTAPRAVGISMAPWCVRGAEPMPRTSLPP